MGLYNLAIREIFLIHVDELPSTRVSRVSNSGLKDIIKGFKCFGLAFFLAWTDIRQRYRRSTLGPFWISISTAVMLGCIGVIFGGIFKSPIQEFLPFLACGLIIWGFISQCLTEATQVFPSSEAVIKQLPLPLFIYVLRMVTRNIYIFCHNLILIPIVLLIVQRPVGLNGLFFFPGMILLVVNITWLSLLIGIICARYRDMAQIVISLLQVCFYVTPIIWMPSLLPERTSAMILGPNPVYHLLEVVRAPLMDQMPTLQNFLFCTFLALFGWLATIFLFDKYRNRIVYWL